MNKTILSLIVVFILLMISPATGLSSGEESNTPPVAFLPSDTYKFEQVVEGVQVVHDFIIENRGKSLLKILGVKPGCGCTNASYPMELAPGGTGKISLTFNSTGYGGMSVNKKTRVETNDPENASFFLTISGDIERFVLVEPANASLSGAAGDEIKTEIRISPNRNAPFEITEITTRDEGNIRPVLKEVKDTDGVQFILTIINLRKTAAAYTDRVYLKTNNTSNPTIAIDVSGEIQ